MTANDVEEAEKTKEVYETWFELIHDQTTNFEFQIRQNL
jgi:hypothetical protein